MVSILGFMDERIIGRIFYDAYLTTQETNFQKIFVGDVKIAMYSYMNKMEVKKLISKTNLFFSGQFLGIFFFFLLL
jgi:hypothetical protein